MKKRRERQTQAEMMRGALRRTLNLEGGAAAAAAGPGLSGAAVGGLAVEQFGVSQPCSGGPTSQPRSASTQPPLDALLQAGAGAAGHGRVTVAHPTKTYCASAMRAASRVFHRVFSAGASSTAGSLVFEAEREIASLQQSVRESLAVHRLDDALSAALACTSATESLFGKKHVAYAAALNNIAQVHRARGDASAALPFAVDALKTYEHVAGKDSVSTAVARSNVGLLHVALASRVKGVVRLEHARAAAEMLDEALALARRAVEVSARNEGDARAAAVRLGVALCHAASAARLSPATASGPSRAEALLVESLETLRAAAGPRATVTATALNNLGLVLKDQGKFKDACTYYAEALSVRRERLGAAHADSIITAHNFAECRRAAGDEEGALEIQREIISLTNANEDDTPIATNTTQ